MIASPVAHDPASEIFSLNPDLDVPALAKAYARDGRIEIRDLLSAGGADRLRSHLLDRRDWTIVMNAGDRVWEMAEPALAELTGDQRRTLDDKLYRSAGRGFQYRFRTIRIDDDRARRGGSLLDRFADFMNGAAMLDLLNRVTDTDIDFVDAQATRYEQGDFLTAHDDAVEGKHRHAAYVFGLSPDWRPEAGGLLLFHGDDGQIDGGFTPAFGALRLFRVPTLHSVSFVSPIASSGRLSITGWLRRTAGQD
ncbi:2OG-Fe(II) oxygenase [Sphingomonas turrisvirgatae]|uniref:Fe2OG dioxygenase domain-containing protein n=1 Tax=Sphingomonas turrisvirgatae TaxID=1888892 RepID=A0A1E3LQU0_9SPHN|nr:2OG-Fe(II) oxygenase family protein [Sphingomonas turrisvirgatae]ODP36142.1 hypothetical protein BFL28_06945 [Sphingomonas turrisvirgatae]